MDESEIDKSEEKLVLIIERINENNTYTWKTNTYGISTTRDAFELLGVIDYAKEKLLSDIKQAVNDNNSGL